MSNKISPNEKYSKYLERLIEDFERLDSKFRNIQRFYSLLDEYVKELDKVSGSLYSFIDGLHTSIVVHTNRLFDKNSISIYELISIANAHIDKITWSRKPTEKELDDQLNRVDKINLTLKMIKAQRDKQYAHLDKNPTLDLENFSTNNPLYEKHIQEAIDLAQKLLQEHFSWKNNAHRELKVVGSENIKTLFELIRIGNKYWKTEFETDFRN